MLALLSLFAPAFASEWYLETGARPERTEVATWEQREVERGVDAHLVRRFVDGQGWRFVLRAEGLAGEDAAMEAARGMADRLGVAISVLEVDAGKTTRRGEVTPSGRVAAAPVVEGPDPDEALARAVEAMGNTEALLTAIRDGKILFGYRRTLADGRVIDHTWAASGTGLYLETEPVEGAVVASRLKVVDEAAWLSVDGGPWSSQNAEKARSTIEATGPVEVVPLVWMLGRAVETRREFERMRVAAPGTFDGRPTTVLEFGGDAVTGALTLHLAADGLPCRVEFGGGGEVHEFRAWTRVKGVAIPGEVRTWRAGALSDIVAVDVVDTAPSLPTDWFRAPSR
jgi:hypothetical protein